MPLQDLVGLNILVGLTYLNAEGEVLRQEQFHGLIDEAANGLAGAYLLEGNELFSQDDPKYLTFIKSQLEPPPGGWPEGW